MRQQLVYPELEGDVTRQKIIIGMLEEFPSLIADVKAFIEDFENGEV